MECNCQSKDTRFILSLWFILSKYFPTRLHHLDTQIVIKLVKHFRKQQRRWNTSFWKQIFKNKIVSHSKYYLRANHFTCCNFPLPHRPRSEFFDSQVAHLHPGFLQQLCHSIRGNKSRREIHFQDKSRINTSTGLSHPTLTHTLTNPFLATVISHLKINISGMKVCPFGKSISLSSTSNSSIRWLVLPLILLQPNTGHPCTKFYWLSSGLSTLLSLVNFDTISL